MVITKESDNKHSVVDSKNQNQNQNTCMNMGNTSTKTTRQLEPMIDNEDWAGINRLLQHHYHTATGNTKKILQFLSSKDLLLELLMKKDDEEAKKLFLMLVILGGKKFVTQNLKFEELHLPGYKKQGTLLHFACGLNVSKDLLSKLIDVGGRDLVVKKDQDGWNSLHYACEYNVPSDIVSKLVNVGGRDFLFEKDDENGCNSLHWACIHDASIDVISELVSVGGRDLVMATDKDGWNSLRFAIYNELSVEVALVDLLTQHGGAEILTQMDNDGKIPLQSFIAKNLIDEDGDDLYEEIDYTTLIDNTSLLISRGIALQVGGEYEIGGLFSSTSDQEVKYKIYENWDRIVLPALEKIMTLSHGQHLPIIQAVIINKAPPRIIKATVNRFAESINTTDSLGQLPIDVAVQHKLLLDNGMQEIVEAFLSSEEPSTVLRVCINNGLQWENGMRAVVEGVGTNDIERQDEATGLYPLMAAGICQDSQTYDFDSVFHLIKKSPQLVRR